MIRRCVPPSASPPQAAPSSSPSPPALHPRTPHARCVVRIQKRFALSPRLFSKATGMIGRVLNDSPPVYRVLEDHATSGVRFLCDFFKLYQTALPSKFNHGELLTSQSSKPFSLPKP
ncbi:hypothetical protein E2C01_086594 [Portunus trituberculatus]|uniref:Uncharacterized protein n=1 Tax=Portunus trituberculatus TaxID=210409 RepID=A0A5B7J9Q4_PORTR|nr:hypothetical protein [Portunus trituberculatus]